MHKIELIDGHLYFDKGKFDNWCVYEINSKGRKFAPKDIDYFTELYEYSKLFGNKRLYSDLIVIYDLTSNYFDEKVVKKIQNISLNYNNFQDQIYKTFCTIYMAMISEENKQNTKLGKRIKRLGLYYLLIKNKTPEYCSNFMKDKNWKEIDLLCKEGNF